MFRLTLTIENHCSMFFFFFFEPIYIPEYKPKTKPGRSYEPLHLGDKSKLEVAHGN
jgi:hypothetical protein